MSYQDTTYIIFDGDKDCWAYARMKGWKALENIDFDFQDAHDLRNIRDWSLPDTYHRRDPSEKGPLAYSESLYRNLDLL